ncbi:hypothetical protein M2404_003804 [Rheinheimera pacifica]|uniref:hypothetical protein n=1 Tax=Rheinheimera pacifica TaxID=173990 RepID=UPI0021679C32|nr:hypothetical protein [Rheinheimera pacifica]MCS4309432.1 hypothetical protein [Rheinheimera pacifica]
MKNVILALIFTFPIYSYAQSGKAIINNFQSSNYGQTNRIESFIYLSNISVSSTTVRITFYDKNGSVVTDGDDSSFAGLLRAENVSSYSDNNSEYSLQFVLGSNKSTRVSIMNPINTDIYGYAVVEWMKEDAQVQSLASYSLIGHSYGYRVYNGSTGYYSIPINNGEPF